MRLEVERSQLSALV